MSTPGAKAVAPQPVKVGEKSVLPTRKWFAQQITAAGTFLVALIQNGWELSSELQVVLVGLVIGAIATYVTPNENTPGGVPLKGSVKNDERGQVSLEFVVRALLFVLVIVVILVVLFALLDRI